MIESAQMDYDYSHLLKKHKKNIPLILQLVFIVIGAFLIIAFACLLEQEPQSADALFSPLINSKKQEKEEQINYHLVYADNKKIIYKESGSNQQSLTLMKLNTNLSQEIIKGKRVGFIGAIDSSNFLVLEDNEGLSRFIVKKYNFEDQTSKHFLAFDSLETISSSELDHLVSISPDKTNLAITHRSGIVIYNLQSEKETTILDNSASCIEETENCLSYYQPIWVNNNSLLIFQKQGNSLTPVLVSTQGKIMAVFPEKLGSLAPCQKGLPLIGIHDFDIYLVEAKKTTPVLVSEQTEYQTPVWLAKDIIAFTLDGPVKSVIKTDVTGKKVVTLEEFLTEVTLSDLITDESQETAFFTSWKKENSSYTLTFYKIGKEDIKPISFYSLSKKID